VSEREKECVFACVNERGSERVVNSSGGPGSVMSAAAVVVIRRRHELENVRKAIFYFFLFIFFCKLQSLIFPSFQIQLG